MQGVIIHVEGEELRITDAEGEETDLPWWAAEHIEAYSRYYGAEDEVGGGEVEGENVSPHAG